MVAVLLLSPTTAWAEEEAVADDEGSGSYDAGAEGRSAFDEAVSRIRGEVRLDARWEWVTGDNDAGNGSNDPAAAFTVSPSRHKRDFDVFAYLLLYSEGLGHEALDVKFSSRFEWDLAGDPFRYEFADFRDDRRSSRAHFGLRELYAEARIMGPRNAFVNNKTKVSVKGGRFDFWEAEWGSVDGAQINVEDLGPVSASVFGGVRASHYDSRKFKRILGGHVTIQPVDQFSFTVSDVLHIDNSLELSARVEPTEWMFIGASTKFVNDDIDDFRAWVDIDFAKQYFNIFLGYRSVFDNSDKFDYDYTDTDTQVSRKRFNRNSLNFLQESGSDDYEIKLYKGFGVSKGTFGIFLQGRRHDIRSDFSKIDQYNFDYWEGTVGFDLHDLPFEGFFAETRLSYVDPDHPASRSGNGAEQFQDLRSEGETEWIEWYNHIRASVFYYRLTIGAEFYYRQFNYRTRFVRLEDLRQWGYGAYVLFKATDKLRFRVDYFYEGAFEIVDQDIEWHQSLRVGVKYQF